MDPALQRCLTAADTLADVLRHHAAVRPVATAVTFLVMKGYWRQPQATRAAIVDVLPRNPSGKILKRVLREPYWTGHDRQVK